MSVDMFCVLLGGRGRSISSTALKGLEGSGIQPVTSRFVVYGLLEHSKR